MIMWANMMISCTRKSPFAGLEALLLDCLSLSIKLTLDLETPFLHYRVHLHTKRYLLQSDVDPDHLHASASATNARDSQAERAASDRHEQAITD